MSGSGGYYQQAPRRGEGYQPNNRGGFQPSRRGGRGKGRGGGVGGRRNGFNSGEGREYNEDQGTTFNTTVFYQSPSYNAYQGSQSCYQQRQPRRQTSEFNNYDGQNGSDLDVNGRNNRRLYANNRAVTTEPQVEIISSPGEEYTHANSPAVYYNSSFHYPLHPSGGEEGGEGSRRGGGKRDERQKLLEEAAAFLNPFPREEKRTPPFFQRDESHRPSSGRSQSGRLGGEEGTKPTWRWRGGDPPGGGENWKTSGEGGSQAIRPKSNRGSGGRGRYIFGLRDQVGRGGGAIGKSWRGGDGGGRGYLNNDRGKSSRVEDGSQRSRLEEGLKPGGDVDCLVCCDTVRPIDQVWSCPNCYAVLHLVCTTKWAISSSTQGVENTGWRCPACQNINSEIPMEYFCMCGKIVNPKLVKGETPHTCGQVCGKSRGGGCPHRCVLLCHPGPCPPCSSDIEKECGCGRTKKTMRCSTSSSGDESRFFSCGSICGKTLNCGAHECLDVCHSRGCRPCQVTLTLSCWCGEEVRESICNETTSKGGFSCGLPCSKKLECPGSHPCPLSCHPPPCLPPSSCPLSTKSILTCPCGGTPSTAFQPPRGDCTDPIPTCGRSCPLLPLSGCPHPCPSTCHLPPCPPCPLSWLRPCRCGKGNSGEEVACASVKPDDPPPLCNRKCNKKRSCVKHKCNQYCCIDEEHICPLPCNKTLSCGRHKCQLLCHIGLCTPCSDLSFEELSCECGEEVILPPVPCGTRRPQCNKPCSRSHPCDSQHPPTHPCHSSPTCPPCTALVARECFGGHELRKSVPCHLGEFSCGRECGRPLAGCGHPCRAPCHSGDCPLPCRRPCSDPRPGCGHPCSVAPCHPAPRSCPRPRPPCTAQVPLSCTCGRRKTSRPCSEVGGGLMGCWPQPPSAILAMGAAGTSSSNNPQVPTGGIPIPPTSPLKVLECDDECKIYERNLRLAIGLQIVNPDLSSKLSPRYTDTLKSWVKRDPQFCQMVHEKLTQLVQLAKESKQKSRSHSFEPMNKEKRQFIHEYCKHFGVEGVAYDAEPKRNIVATAYKDKSWLPSYSLMEVVQRETTGQRRVLPPTLPLSSLKKEQQVSSPLLSTLVSIPGALSGNSTSSNGGGGGGSSGVNQSQSSSLKESAFPGTQVKPQIGWASSTVTSNIARPQHPSTSGGLKGTSSSSVKDNPNPSSSSSKVYGNNNRERDNNGEVPGYENTNVVDYFDYI